MLQSVFISLEQIPMKCEYSWPFEIKYSLYYLLWRSLHSSVCVVISFTMTIHPCVFNMNENSISRRYSQCWWAAEIVSDHYSAYIESIYLNRMKMWCERPHLCNTTRQAASLTGLLHTGFSQKRRSISKRRFGQPFSLLYRWNLFFLSSIILSVLKKQIAQNNMLDHHIIVTECM